MRKRASMKRMISQKVMFRNGDKRKTLEEVVLWVMDHTGKIAQIDVDARSEGDQYVVTIYYRRKAGNWIKQ